MAQQKKVIGYIVRKFPVLSETFILNEILALEAKGVSVEIFSLAPTRDPRFHEGVVRLRATIHYVPGASELRMLLRHAWLQASRNPRLYRRELLRVVATGRPKLLWRFLQASYIAERARRLGVRHVHAHFANHPTTVTQQVSRLLDVPYSFTAHAFDIYRNAKPRIIARKMKDARFTVTVSDYNVDFLRTVGNGNGARIELIRNGIDMTRFAPAVTAPAGTFTMLTVARLVEKKGLAVLIEACRHLRDRGVEFRCDIVGKGAQKGELQRLIREWQLGGRVRLLGALPQQEIVAHYHSAHVLVLPCIVGRDGNRDGLPVSIIEALACGLPVISTPVTGIPEAVRDGVNGLIVPSGNAGAVSDAVEKLVRNPELLARLRAAARPSVMEEFDQDRTAASLHALLHEEAA